MPERTCVCCRKKSEKENLIRLSEIENKYVFDEKMNIQNRGFYICQNSSCVEKLSKHKKYNIEIIELKIKLIILPKDIKEKYIDEFKRI